MFNKKLLFVALITTVSSLSGCKGGLFGGTEAAPAPQPPPAPIVVDGMRTSYADVVEKTSPAVVRIEASHKEKATPQGQNPAADDFFKQFQSTLETLLIGPD